MNVQGEPPENSPTVSWLVDMGNRRLEIKVGEDKPRYPGYAS